MAGTRPLTYLHCSHYWVVEDSFKQLNLFHCYALITVINLPCITETPSFRSLPIAAEVGLPSAKNLVTITFWLEYSRTHFTDHGSAFAVALHTQNCRGTRDLWTRLHHWCLYSAFRKGALKAESLAWATNIAIKSNFLCPLSTCGWHRQLWRSKHLLPSLFCSMSRKIRVQTSRQWRSLIRVSRWRLNSIVWKLISIRPVFLVLQCPILLSTSCIWLLST